MSENAIYLRQHLQPPQMQAHIHEFHDSSAQIIKWKLPSLELYLDVFHDLEHEK